MFDAFRVHQWAWGGKLKKHPDLGKTYWLYMFSHLFSLIAACYTAFMSYKFWYYSLGNVAYANILAWMITSVIAAVAFVFLAYVGYYINSRYRGHHVTKNETQTFKVSLIISICVIGFDVFANLKGVEEHAHVSTTQVIDNKTGTIDNSYQSRIDKIEQNAKNEVDRHLQGIAAIKDLLGKKHNCNTKGCEKGTRRGKTGAAHWAGAITPYGYAAIKAHEDAIQSIQNSAERRISDIENKQGIALKEHASDRDMSRSKYNRHVGLKINGHSSFVKLLYLIVLFLALVTAEYIREAKIFTNNSDVYKRVNYERTLAQRRIKHEAKMARKTIDSQYDSSLDEEGEEETDEAPKDNITPPKKGILKSIIGDPDDNPIKKALDKYEGVKVEDDEGDKSVARTGSVANFKENPEWEREGKMRVVPQVATVAPQGYEIECQNCGTKSRKPTQRAKYCDDKCRKEFYNKKKSTIKPITV